MSRAVSRRDFLKVSGLALSGLAFMPHLGTDFPRPSEQENGYIARVTVDEIDLYAKPRDDSEIIGKRYRDQIVHIYYEVKSPQGPSYNPLWYRVWGGYLHSRFLQIVTIRHNPISNSVSENGQLCEVTVPYTTAYQYKANLGWYPWDGERLYYETTHWATAIDTGPDGEAWYQLTSELYSGLKYFVPAAHLRPIPDEELAPISPTVPDEKKRIEVSISQQKFTAFEYDQVVYTARISSGIPSRKAEPDDFPTATPLGRYRIYSKMPNKHMGSVSGNPDADNGDGFSLPGVPWTCFFVNPGGYALHGTYWHNNFGIQMSHGCINMRNDDAKWLFRWSTPVFNTPIESQEDWERRGNGTQVEVVK
jgi:lipoprotein-anchoring transpeptidase ErfK/SrfK